MRQLFFVVLGSSLAACGGSGSSGGVTQNVMIDPMIAVNDPLPATKTAADLVDFSQDYDAVEATYGINPLNGGIPADEVRVTATYNGEFRSSFPIFEGTENIDPGVQISGDMEMNVDFRQLEFDEYEVTGTISNVNLMRDSVPFETLDGELNIRANRIPASRGLISGRADGTLTGTFGQEDVTDMTLVLGLQGQMRGGNRAYIGRVSGSGTGTYGTNSIFGDFYVLRDDLDIPE